MRGGGASLSSGDAPVPAPRNRWTLRRRLVLVLVALLAAMAATTGVVSALALRGSLLDQLDSQVLAASARAAGAPERPMSFGQDSEWEAGSDQPQFSDDDLPPGLDVPGQGAGTINLFVRGDESRSGYIDSAGEIQELTDAQVAALESLPPTGAPQTVELENLGAYRVVATETDDDVRVVTGLSTLEAAETVRDYVAVQVGVAVIGILLALVVGRVLVRRELRPLERVAATATRVSELSMDRGEVALTERVDATDTDPGTEVGQVGAALNRLLGRVEHALAARQDSEMQVRQFVADASHELRTPLASIRGYAELVRHLPADLPPDVLRAMGRVESESQRMTALVEDMLLLARLDAGRPLGTADVDLAALAVDAVADAHAAGPDHVWLLDLPGGSRDEVGDREDAGERDDAGDRGEAVEVESADQLEPPRAVVVGDDHRLQQVLVNLLSNARVHTPAGTTVRTTVRVDGGRVSVRVEDDGPGIPEPLRARLFQRFTRGDAARSPGAGSTGLGLAIVDAVIGAHDGTIEVQTRPGSTAFTVSLPAAP